MNSNRMWRRICVAATSVATAAAAIYALAAPFTGN
jgi:hypothetical protein